MKKKVKLELKKYQPNELIVGMYRFSKQKNILYSIDDNDIEFMLDQIENGKNIDMNFVHPYLISNDEVVATPDQIGLTYDVEYETISGGELKDIQLWELQEIINNDFTCSVEMVDEFSHPELFQHVGWGDGLPIPRFVNDKIVILKN